MIEKNKIIYLILGIGIGIIVTNLINSAYPKIEYIELSEEEIVEKAEELGMIKIKENIKIESEKEKKEKLEPEKEIIEDTSDEVEKLEKDPKKLEDEDIEKKTMKKIVVEEGTGLRTVAKQLHKEKLINNEEEFIFYVKGKKMEKKINVGTYDINSGSSYTEIINILTHRSQ